MHRFASRSCRLLVVVCLAGVSGPRSAQGEFAEPPSAPVERLIRNVQAHLADHPDDAQAYYVLARLHTLALATSRDTLRAYNPDQGVPRVDLPYAPIA